MSETQRAEMTVVGFILLLLPGPVAVAVSLTLFGGFSSKEAIELVVPGSLFILCAVFTVAALVMFAVVILDQWGTR